MTGFGNGFLPLHNRTGRREKPVENTQDCYLLRAPFACASKT
jgi:hypothetical protein